jgi:hypothetical protein
MKLLVVKDSVQLSKRDAIIIILVFLFVALGVHDRSGSHPCVGENCGYVRLHLHTST